MKPEKHTCRGTLVLDMDTKKFRLLCLLLCSNTTWREREGERRSGISEQTDTATFIVIIRFKMYSGPIYQPSHHQRVCFYLPIHSILFISSLKGNSCMCPDQRYFSRVGLFEIISFNLYCLYFWQLFL